MAKPDKYGLRDLQRDFGTDDACLEFLFDALHSRTCSCGGSYRRISGRRQYQCSKCRYQIAPTAGTIFHKSDTPLSLWFYAIYLFSNAKSGLSAKQLERDLNVTYKTAYRILQLVRKALGAPAGFLSGDVEVDETYFGGRFRSGPNNREHHEALRRKSVIVGAVQRRGQLKAVVSPDARAKTLGAFLDASVDPISSRLLTDTSSRYLRVAKRYHRESVNHSKREYVRGDVHTNTIESFWGHLKRSLRGVHKSVSREKLPLYVDGFVFHYNNRHSDSQRFAALLGAVLLSSRLPRTAGGSFL